MKKASILVAFVMLVSLIFSGCSIGRESAPETAPNPAIETSTETPIVSEDTSSGALGDYTVSIMDYELLEDYEGKPAIRIYYEFTNNGDDDASFMFAVSGKAFQNGIELETAIAKDSADEDNNSLKDIKTGATLICTNVYLLQDESPVQVEVTELISFNDNEILTKTFDINAGSGTHTETSSSAEASESATAPDSSQEVSSGELGDYTVSILDYELLEDYDGNPAIRIYFEFTNNGDEDTSFMFAVTDKAFQNGIELETAFVTDHVDEDDNSIKDIKTGATITCTGTYKLVDESPVLVEVTKLFSFNDDVQLTKTFIIAA